MGTRSLTFVYENDKPILNMYRQFDGYPSGHGAELATFLGSGDRKIVNGFGNDNADDFNGMGCLAAQMIADFKQGIGGIYIEPVTDEDCGQDYTYKVYNNRVEVYDYNTLIFKGNYAEFTEFCKSN